MYEPTVLFKHLNLNFHQLKLDLHRINTSLAIIMTMLLSLGIVSSENDGLGSTYQNVTVEELPTIDGANMQQVLIISPFVPIIYFSVLLTIILLSIFLSWKRNVIDERKRIVREMKKMERPPSYTRIYFSEDPPEYHDIVTKLEEAGDDDVQMISI